MSDHLSSNQQVDRYKCFYPLCTVSPRTGGSVFRINAKGQPGVFACREHMKQTDAAPIHPDVDRVVSVIEGRKP